MEGAGLGGDSCPPSPGGSVVLCASQVAPWTQRSQGCRKGRCKAGARSFVGVVAHPLFRSSSGRIMVLIR